MALTPSSTPPGARVSARTVPVTATDVSWVRIRKVSHAAASTSPLATTHCRYPVPSRSTRKAIFPLDRVVETHPRTVTSSPMCAGRSHTRSALVIGRES